MSRDDPAYIELRARIERFLWVQGYQGLDSKYLRIGRYNLSMFTGDGEPHLISAEMNSPPPTRAIYTILSDSSGDFDEELGEELSAFLRAKMVLDDLADA